MVMFVSGSVIVAVTTTHNVWEISIHKSNDEDHPFYYYAEDMELQRVYRLIPERDGSKPQRWTIEPT
jgi:hypothetical protein